MWRITLILTLFPALGLALPDGWSYSGCIYEGIGNRVMNITFYQTDTMTPDFCSSYCARMNMGYAGLAVGQQCFCQATPPVPQLFVDTPHCNYTCPGDDSTYNAQDGSTHCGGYGYLSLFTNPNLISKSQASPVPVPSELKTATTTIRMMDGTITGWQVYPTNSPSPTGSLSFTAIAAQEQSAAAAGSSLPQWGTAKVQGGVTVTVTETVDRSAQGLVTRPGASGANATPAFKNQQAQIVFGSKSSGESSILLSKLLCLSSLMIFIYLLR